MNAARHYREAEQLLNRANDSTTYDEAAGIIAQAHVHATLALVAIELRNPHDPQRKENDHDGDARTPTDNNAEPR